MVWRQGNLKKTEFGYSWLPRLDDGQICDVLNMIDNMSKGKIKGLICVAQNPACSLPNSNKVREAFKNLDWMVHVNISIMRQHLSGKVLEWIPKK